MLFIHFKMDNVVYDTWIYNSQNVTQQGPNSLLYMKGSLAVK